MKRKIKTLSKLYEIKDFEQKDIQNQINNLQRELNKEKAKLEMLENMFSNAFTEFRKKHQSSIHIHELGLFYDYLSNMNKNIDDQRVLIKEKLDELDSKKDTLFETYKQKKIYENLTDRLLKIQKKEYSASIQKEIDFLFISRKNKEDE